MTAPYNRAIPSEWVSKEMLSPTPKQMAEKTTSTIDKPNTDKTLFNVALNTPSNAPLNTPSNTPSNVKTSTTPTTPTTTANQEQKTIVSAAAPKWTLPTEANGLFLKQNPTPTLSTPSYFNFNVDHTHTLMVINETLRSQRLKSTKVVPLEGKNLEANDKTIKDEKESSYMQFNIPPKMLVFEVFWPSNFAACTFAHSSTTMHLYNLQTQSGIVAYVFSSPILSITYRDTWIGIETENKCMIYRLTDLLPITRYFDVPKEKTMVTTITKDIWSAFSSQNTSFAPEPFFVCDHVKTSIPVFDIWSKKKDPSGLVKILTATNKEGEIQCTQLSSSSKKTSIGGNNGIEGINVQRKEVHSSNLRVVQFSIDGDFIATASETGTLIRVFNRKFDLIQEFRRGSSNANIHSIAFTQNSSHIAVFSSQNTIHVFSLLHKENVRSSLYSISGWLPSYFSSEWSLMQHHFFDHAGEKGVMAFDSQDHLHLLIPSRSLIYELKMNETSRELDILSQRCYFEKEVVKEVVRERDNVVTNNLPPS